MTPTDTTPHDPYAIPTVPAGPYPRQGFSPSRALWAACGSPAHPDAAHLPADFNGGDDRCWICAAGSGFYGAPINPVLGHRFVTWDGAKFTGQNKIKCPAGAMVCAACLWLMSRASAVPGRPAKPGQACGPNWRNFSVLFAPGEPLLIASKGEKPAIREWLRRPHRGPWFAALADSGQKHVVMWAPVNGGGEGPGRPARLLWDERLVTIPGPGDAGWGLVDDTAELLTAGGTKEEVTSGVWGHHAVTRCEALIRAYEAAHGCRRGSAWFDLAVWLAQRDEEAVAARMAEEKATRDALTASRKTTPTRPAKGAATAPGATAPTRKTRTPKASA